MTVFVPILEKKNTNIIDDLENALKKQVKSEEK
jgi:hypothetical protein